MTAREWVLVSLRPSQMPRAAKIANDQGAVDFDGMIDDQEAVLHQLEEDNQRSAEEAIDQDMPFHGFGSHQYTPRGKTRLFMKDKRKFASCP
jgi:hypothetical protein